jgi:hypothetical protein
MDKKLLKQVKAFTYKAYAGPLKRDLLGNELEFQILSKKSCVMIRFGTWPLNRKVFWAVYVARREKKGSPPIPDVKENKVFYDEKEMRNYVSKMKTFALLHWN